ncbi:MAG: ATP-binding protein [Actinobacteria bacterium]|nr:ATP-binding protein [Actinomycetota bacterium]
MSGAQADQLQRWLDDRAPEGQRLDFKQALHLVSKSDKRETLKDLTAMGNGGGGMLVFGVAEAKADGETVADYVVELTDPALPGRLRDLIATSVRPTLRWHPSVVEQARGYVLVVEIERSPLGPYMVESHGEHRYWRRVHDQALPMDERLVHDMYAEAARWESNRDALWAELRLPLEPTWSARPWLSVSAVPEYLVGQPFDPSVRDLESLRYELEDTDCARIAGLDQLGARFGIWSDGFVAEADADRAAGTSFPPAPQALARIHRSGALGIGLHLATAHRLDAVRALNAHLDYAGRLWTSAGISAIELRIELSQLHQVASDPDEPFPLAHRATGAPPPGVAMQEIVRVDDLTVAVSRHRMLRRFADRIANAFGERRSTRRVRDRAPPHTRRPGRWSRDSWSHPLPTYGERSAGVHRRDGQCATTGAPRGARLVAGWRVARFRGRHCGRARVCDRRLPSSGLHALYRPSTRCRRRGQLGPGGLGSEARASATHRRLGGR